MFKLHTVPRVYCCRSCDAINLIPSRYISTIYAESNPRMRIGNACAGDNFPGGITNGAHWYSLSGGMQDYNYHYTNCFEITVEMSCCKYPLNSSLRQFWLENKDSLIAYMQQVHSGVKGIVRRNNTPVVNGTVSVLHNSKVVKTTKDGEYWRLLMPGKYVISAGGCSKNVAVEKGRVTRMDFDLADTNDCLARSTANIYGHKFNLVPLVLTSIARFFFY